MTLRHLTVLFGLLSYLAVTVAGGSFVFCTGPEGSAVELAVSATQCAESCEEEKTAGDTRESPTPECIDEVVDVEDVRVAASAPIAFPPPTVLLDIVPYPAPRLLQFEERKPQPPQHLAHVATVVLVI